MAGFGTKLMSVGLAIPIAKFLNDKLESSWRATTGTEPPSIGRRRQQEKDNKKAAKLGLPPRPVDDPKFVDALMWSALSAMSVVVVRYAAERGAEEITKFFTGDNPATKKYGSQHNSGKSGRRHGKTGSKILR